MILHGIEYQRPTSLNMRIMADHVTYSFLAFMKSIFHFCLGCYCGGYSQNGRSNLSSYTYHSFLQAGGYFNGFLQNSSNSNMLSMGSVLSGGHYLGLLSWYPLEFVKSLQIHWGFAICRYQSQWLDLNTHGSALTFQCHSKTITT